MRGARLVWIVGLVLAVMAGPALAKKSRGKTRARSSGSHPCLERLDALDVPYEKLRKKPGIRLPVKVKGPISGVRYRTWRKHELVLDCSLVYSLAVAGRWLKEAGVDEVFYSSAWQRRKIRGTNTPSQHSFGLAIDLHEFHGERLGKLTVQHDYEQGLGDSLDCVGAPLTTPGALLRLLFCQMDRSGLFRFILTPDYDGGHYNHFHVEAPPWHEREDRHLPPRALTRQ